MQTIKQPFFIVSALVIASLTTFYFSNSWISVLVLFIGILLGATLNYFHFGFSSSFRALIEQRKTSGMRAIVWMLGLAILLFAPLLAMESIGEQSYYGHIRPLSLSVAVGAFVFGIGMQIGCGCTSGTLTRVGQIQPLALPTLFFMVIGGTLAAFTFDIWRNWPTFEPVAYQSIFNWPLAILLQILILSAIYLLFHRTENRQHQTVEALFKPGSIHPWLLAATGLALLNALLFLVAGAPWSIASIFPYWGVRIIDVFSLPVDWSFWDYSIENDSHLSSEILSNQVSLTTMGVIIGALAVSIYKPRAKVPLKFNNTLASIIGGLIMGFGAVMASGCNIGAFFSGIASGSLHGWLWFIFALFGNLVGLKLRYSLFKLS